MAECHRLKHPLIKTNVAEMPEYKSWRSMKRRCLDKKSIRYKNYGGRGIKICERWMDFTRFLDDMGIKPSGAQIERIDNNGNYEPINCRWATAKENSNNRRSNTYLEFNGLSLTISQWSDKLKIDPRTISMRLLRGFSIEKILSVTPLPKTRNRSS